MGLIDRGSRLGRVRSVLVMCAAVLASVTLTIACGPAPQLAPPATTAVAEHSTPAPERGGVNDRPAAPSSERVAAERYDLGPDEKRGGHTLERHVGRTDDQLRERLRREQQIIAASTYTDRETAERTVGRTLAAHRPQVEAWLNRQGDRPNLVLDFHDPDDQSIGRSIERGSKDAVPCQDAIVVLRWGGERTFYVLTSYPMAAS